MENKVFEYFGIEIDALKAIIEEAPDLASDKEFFNHLSSVSAFKKKLKDALEELDALEKDVKGLINSRAKALYGPDWQVIAGDHFKITRSKTGDMYTINGNPSPQFIKVKKTVDSKLVEEFIVKNDKLPKGIEINDQRGESLRITIK